MFNLEKDIKLRVAQKLASLHKVTEESGSDTQSEAMLDDDSAKHGEQFEVSNSRGVDERLTELFNTISDASQKGAFDLGNTVKLDIDPSSILQHIDTPKK